MRHDSETNTLASLPARAKRGKMDGMLRKAIIVVLTVGAVATLGL